MKLKKQRFVLANSTAISTPVNTDEFKIKSKMKTSSSVTMKTEIVSEMTERLENEHLYNPVRDGITQSRINTWRNCPTMARIINMGIVSAHDSEAIAFGSVFHEGLDICQNMVKNSEVKDEVDIIRKMNGIIKQIEKRFDLVVKDASSEVKQHYEDAIAITEIMLPRYFEAWKSDFFGENKKNFIFIEEVFRVEEGFAIPLQGKLDSAYEDASGDVWLMENKTKSRIDEAGLSAWIARDLQVNMYLIALEKMCGKRPKGVMYNVIRRPQLRKKISESKQEFLQRIDEDIKSRMDWYFLRLQVSIAEKDHNEFKRKLAITVKKYKEWFYSDPNDDEEYTHNCIDPVFGACKYLKFCESGKTNFDGLTTQAMQNPELK